MVVVVVLIVLIKVLGDCGSRGRHRRQKAEVRVSTRQAGYLEVGGSALISRRSGRFILQGPLSA